MASSNTITKVAVVGAGGNLGSFITSSLLATGKHTITAITRADSSTALPAGVHVAKINYDEPATIVDALKGNEALVITLGGFAGQDIQPKLIDAAAQAGLKYVFLNEWSPDTASDILNKEINVFAPKAELRKKVASEGKIDFLGLCTGFWYEWSLSQPANFGFNFAEKEVTFFDDGHQKTCISTWPQVGRAVAAILSLPINSDDGLSLEKLKNKLVYVNSFNVSQRDMFESTLRVTGSKESDWTISKEPSHERYAAGLEGIKKGEHIGFAKMMYTRVFYPDGSGDFTSKGLLNQALGLEEDDLDEATKRAIKRSQEVKPWA